MKRMIMLVILIGLSYPAGVLAQMGTPTFSVATNCPAHIASSSTKKEKAKTSSLPAPQATVSPGPKPIAQASSPVSTNQLPDFQSDNHFSPTQIEAARAYDLIKLSPPSSRYDKLMWSMIYHQRDVSFDNDGEPNIFRTFLR